MVSSSSSHPTSPHLLARQWSSHGRGLRVTTVLPRWLQASPASHWQVDSTLVSCSSQRTLPRASLPGTSRSLNRPVSSVCLLALQLCVNICFSPVLLLRPARTISPLYRGYGRVSLFVYPLASYPLMFRAFQLYQCSPQRRWLMGGRLGSRHRAQRNHARPAHTWCTPASGKRQRDSSPGARWHRDDWHPRL